MKLLFTPEALASYNEIKATSHREADQIKDVLKDVLAHPETGKGTPHALTGALAGLWSREYGFCRQIVYQILQDEVKIYAIGKNFFPSGATPSSNFKQTTYSEDEYRSVLVEGVQSPTRKDHRQVCSSLGHWSILEIAR